MDATRFVDSVFGSPVQGPGNKYAFTYYLPKPLPRRAPLTEPVVTVLSEADAALGNLEGLGILIGDPQLLIGPYLHREALASSRIEGTQTSLSDVFQAEVTEAAKTDDTREVQRYLAATRQAFTLVKTLPITQRLLLQVHETLLRGVRGENRRPGQFRSSPVWVGSADATPYSAVFVPPIPEHLPALMGDWERFVNADGRALPALIQAAMAHYQFETIHPFLDGNGRIGRLVINLILTERKRLTQPLLYLSHYFETHRDEYYGHLQRTRESGDITDWLVFFLDAVREQAHDAVRRSRRLIGIREEYRQEAIRTRGHLARLVEMIVQNPYLTARSVEDALGITNAGAHNVIRRAEGLGWLRSIGRRGRGGQESWVAPEILQVLEAPMLYEQSDRSAELSENPSSLSTQESSQDSSAWSG